MIQPNMGFEAFYSKQFGKKVICCFNIKKLIIKADAVAVLLFKRAVTLCR